MSPKPIFDELNSLEVAEGSVALLWFNAFSGFLIKTPRYMILIDPYDIAQAFFRIANLYYDEGDLKQAYKFYNRVIGLNCERPFINREAYFKAGKILFEQNRFKEALVSFVSVLSFDRDNDEVIGYLDDCLRKLGIFDYRDRFLIATPNEARKLIMEVL